MQEHPETYRKEMHNLLRGEIQHTRNFADLLTDEYRVISERDIDTLEQLIDEKKRQLELLSGMERERARILANAGFATGHAGMLDCLHWCDTRHELVVLWHELQSLARTCNDLNRRNQYLVDLCSRHAREVLHVLRGEESGQGTYQADGETDHRHANRTLAKV